MSSPSLHKFVVYAPDQTDEGAFERRLSVRPKDLVNAVKAISDGVIREKIIVPIRLRASIIQIRYIGVGGALLTPESLTGGEKKMVCTIVEESYWIYGESRSDLS